MVDSQLITPALLNYGASNSKELFMLAYQSMDVWNDVTVIPNVKHNTRLTTLMIDNIVKPFKPEFEPTVDAIIFTPRIVGVDVAKADLRVVPEEYRQTYLAEFTPKGVGRTPHDLPFEKFVWESVMAKFGQELNDVTAYFGVKNPAGTTAADVTDGFGTILAEMITDTVLTPVSTGAITSTNAVAQLKMMYRNIPAQYRRPNFGLKAYMSYSTYEAYLDNLDTLSVNTGRGLDTGTKWLRGAEGIMEIKPVSWMGDSGRVIMTPKSNIILASDAVEQDLAKLNVDQGVWHADVGIACALGFNFRYPGLIWTNEVV